MSYADILLPLDGSKYSTFACELAYKLTELVPGQETMHLVHCIEPIPALIGGAEREKLMRDHEAAAEKIFEPCKELFAKLGNPCLTYIRYGSPGETIAALADELNCSLIIMGCRGRNDLTSLLLGSVSSHVLQHAKVPVLLARPAA